MSESEHDTGPFPLAIDADVTITVDEREYLLLVEDDVVTVVAPSLSAAVGLVRSLPTDELDRLGSLLETAGMTVVVRVDEETVATFDTTPQWAPGSDGFDIRSVSVEPRGLVAAVARGVKAAPLAIVGVALALGLLGWWLRRRRRSGGR